MVALLIQFGTKHLRTDTYCPAVGIRPMAWSHRRLLLCLSVTAGQYVSVRRCFVPNWISKATIDKWADWAESQGVYPVISFKVPGNDWAGVAAGAYDLDLLCAILEARGVAGRAPVCVAVH